ncbi:tripartite tricarboxylate transporter substrate-binding protein [Pelagibacterium nitratireducens]|uniref:Tripartite tricarboxylate transporter substrate-binding protein n=1 Tax=Pelagibacterium nitratireducens TaxID=1046114 RepID=A0ABZ2I4T9_9HYPH
MNGFKLLSSRIAALGTAFVLLSAGGAMAQDYPDKPIRLIVPFNAGGGIDTTARFMAEELGAELGTDIIVENVGGGGGSLGATEVARSASDGYTLLYHSATGPAQAAVRDDLPYNWFEDFVPVSQVAAFASAVVVGPSFPADTMAEFIAEVKAHPGEYSYASSGTTTAVHLLSELFNTQAGIDLIHIPYQSTGAATADLIAGRVTMVIDGLPARANDIKAGTLKGLAVTSAERSVLLPDLPTLKETGVNMVDVYWTGVFAPDGTSPEIVDTLATAIAKVMQEPEMIDRLLEVGTNAVGSTPEEFAALSQATYDLYHGIVEADPSLLNE